jgi:hypothetical protein
MSALQQRNYRQRDKMAWYTATDCSCACLHWVLAFHTVSALRIIANETKPNPNSKEFNMLFIQDETQKPLARFHVQSEWLTISPTISPS